MDTFRDLCFELVNDLEQWKLTFGRHAQIDQVVDTVKRIKKAKLALDEYPYDILD
jgi:hypothetical protein